VDVDGCCAGTGKLLALSARESCSVGGFGDALEVRVVAAREVMVEGDN
jgi:hypothetical protein